MNYCFDPKLLLEKLDNGGKDLPGGVDEAVLHVFRTSLLTEEGSPLRPFCVLTPRNTRLQFSTRWQTPIPASKNLTKLSQLTSHGVRALQLEMHDEPMIVSIVEVPRRSIHDGDVWGGRLIEIDAMSAANIRVCSYGGGGGAGVFQAVRYHQGDYYERNFETRIRTIFSTSGVVVNDYLVSKYKNGFPLNSIGLKDLNPEQFDSSIFARGIVGGGDGMKRVFLSAVSRLQRRGLGGALILLGATENADQVPTTNPIAQFESEFVENHTNHWYSVIDWIAANAVYWHARKINVPHESLKPAEDWMNRSLYWMNESATALMSMMIPDGTVVAGKYLQPLGIGVKLSVDIADALRS